MSFQSMFVDEAIASLRIRIAQYRLSCLFDAETDRVINEAHAAVTKVNLDKLIEDWQKWRDT